MTREVLLTNGLQFFVIKSHARIPKNTIAMSANVKV